jgi:hypothetical protein
LNNTNSFGHSDSPAGFNEKRKYKRQHFIIEEKGVLTVQNKSNSTSSSPIATHQTFLGDRRFSPLSEWRLKIQKNNR